MLPPTNPFRLPEKRHVANVFVDLCGSTQAGEKLSNSQDLFELLDRWQRLAAFVLCNYGGKIGASDSDLVMGYFVGSETEDLTISRALLAAVRVREKTIEFGQQVGFPLNAHIGLHCGHVEIGVIGPDARSNLTTIGAPVNIAARLEGKADKGEIFISEDIRRQLRIRWDGEFAGQHALKGVERPLACFRVRSVGFSKLPEVPLHESDVVFAVLEAQALENIGRDKEALEFAEAALESFQNNHALNPRLDFAHRETLIRCLRRVRRSREALKVVESYTQLARNLAAHRELARARFYHGLCLVDQSQFKAALEAMKEAHRGVSEYGNQRETADAHYFMGICYQFMDLRPQARAAHERAKEDYLNFIHNQESDPAEVGKACLELSMLLADDPKGANEVLAIAQKALRDSCQFRHLVTVFLNWSCVENRMMRPTHAENFARRALDLAKDFDPIDGVGFAHGNIGAALENRLRFEEAKTHYEQALAIATRTGDIERSNQLRESIRRVNMRNSGTSL